MKETAYNLFLFVENEVIQKLGIVTHDVDGTDKEKLGMLRASVNSDFPRATLYEIAGGLPYKDYQSKERLGRQMEVFEPILQVYNAPINPLVVVTPIVDSLPKIDVVTGTGALDLSDLNGSPFGEPGVMSDYLKVYLRGGQFHFAELMEDDYFKAIKLIYNDGRYVSAAKLLMSFLDTVAFLEFGDVPESFVNWLNTYLDLSSVGVSAPELWEFRNGVLHMTNAHSRKVLGGKVARLVFYVGDGSHASRLSSESVKYFNLKTLIEEVISALSRWFETYNQDRNKLEQFVARYDLVLSDSRLAYVGGLPAAM